MHRFDCIDRIIAVLARRGEAEFLFEADEKRLGHFFPNSHAPITLHIAVSAHRAKAAAGAADFAGEQMQVDQLANGFDGIVMLGESHRPAGDGFLGLDEMTGCLADQWFR